MIDFHCHVDLYPDALKLLPEINTRNRFTFAVTTSPRAYLITSKILEPYRRMRVGLGLHPEIATQKAQELDLLLELTPATRLIGEIGMDGSARFRSSLPIQEKIFRAALEGCQAAGGKVMSIHSRGAERQVLECPRDVLHNPRESVIVRIGIGRKAAFGSQQPCYWQEKQRSGLPEAALSQTAGSYAGHP